MAHTRQGLTRIAVPITAVRIISNGRLSTPNYSSRTCRGGKIRTATEDYRPGICKLKTTGRGLMAGRRWAAGGLFCVRELAQGVCDH